MWGVALAVAISRGCEWPSSWGNLINSSFPRSGLGGVVGPGRKDPGGAGSERGGRRQAGWQRQGMDLGGPSP